LRLKYDEPLSNLAFNFKLRHYNGADMVDAWLMGHLCRPLREGDWAYHLTEHIKIGETFLNCYKAMSKGGARNSYDGDTSY